MIKLSEIHINPSNPRIIKDGRFKKLVKSLKEFPKMMELRPIVINDSGMILGGNMRYKALKELGYKEVPDNWVKIADRLNEDEQKRFIIEDNVPFGEWDWDMLANEWDQELLDDWGVDISEFELSKPEAVEDDYEIPEKIKTDIVIGDLFEIGEHRLLCGDSTQIETFNKLFDGQMADMVLTDPPYNVNYTGKTKGRLKMINDRQNDSNFYKFLYSFFLAQSTVVKLGGAWYVWHSETEGYNFRLAMSNAGIMIKQCLIWVKSGITLGRQDYQWKHEPCLYGWKNGMSHRWYSDRKQTTILAFDKPNKNAEHPTMKPISLFAYLIGNSSKEGDIVVDAFGGSGTTMVACHQMRRRAYVIELDPKYCQVIIDRMKKLDPEIVILKNGVQIDENRQT